jgi:hypothetical protein
MRQLLKIKCVDSKVNTHILASTKSPIYTYDGASAKFSTNSHKTDNSAEKSSRDLVTSGMENGAQISQIINHDICNRSSCYLLDACTLGDL